MHYAERELFRYTKGSVARHRELPSNAQEKAWYMFERSESCHAQALRPVVSGKAEVTEECRKRSCDL